jgi:hypothetical protein
VGERSLAIQETGGEAVVAIKLDVVKGGSDTVPAGNGCRFDAAHMGIGDHDDVAQAKGLADENDLDLNGSASGELLGAKEIDARGANVSRDESDGMNLRRTTRGAKTEREIEGGAGIFTVLGENANGVGWNANETAGLRGNEERLQTQSWGARSLRTRNRKGRGRANVRGKFVRPILHWKCAFRRVQCALRDANSLSLAVAQQN